MKIRLINEWGHKTSLNTWRQSPVSEKRSMKLQWWRTRKWSFWWWRSAEHLCWTSAKRKPHTRSVRAGLKACEPFADCYRCHMWAAERHTVRWIRYSICCSPALCHWGTHLLVRAKRGAGNLNSVFTPANVISKHFFLGLSHFKALWTWYCFAR